jgi:hypothetical protein
MTTTYNWVVTQTDYETSNGFITTAHWTCNAVDGDYTASIYSTSSWASGTPTIPYASVTMAEVLDWCWANGVDKTATEAALAQNIELQKNPVTATGVPWSQA